MRAVISVMGKDRPGIIARISAVLYESNVNILDLEQTVMRDELFVMTMLVDLAGMSKPFRALQEKLDEAAGEMGIQVKLQREEIFKSMHRV
ncbi:MAG TPA: ACT domain-containing protein [Clostridiales bacterium]|nr:ACT domain-containing protein [Clostridiales bacterium]